MIYLLAVIEDAEAAARALAGSTERDLAVADYGDVACIGLEWSGPPPEPEFSELWQHDRWIQALMQAGTVVPFRFATTVGDAGEMERWLRAQRRRLVSLLRWLRGRVEMTVRVSVSGANQSRPRPAASGSSKAIAGDLTAAPEALRLHGLLVTMSVDCRVLTLDGDGSSASYLVDVGRVDGFRRTVGALHTRMPGRKSALHVSVTGPWAPYSFVGRVFDDGGAGAGLSAGPDRERWTAVRA